MSLLKSFFSAINMYENWNAQYNGCTGVYYIDTHVAYIIPLSIPPPLGYRGYGRTEKGFFTNIQAFATYFISAISMSENWNAR